jgi:hypothetical protein
MQEFFTDKNGIKFQIIINPDICAMQCKGHITYQAFVGEWGYNIKNAKLPNPHEGMQTAFLEMCEYFHGKSEYEPITADDIKSLCLIWERNCGNQMMPKILKELIFAINNTLTYQ